MNLHKGKLLSRSTTISSYTAMTSDDLTSFSCINSACNVEKRFLKLFCKLPGAIMGQNRRSGRNLYALVSHHNFFWTRHFIDCYANAHRLAHPFWPGKFVFFRNDHFYCQKVTPFRALRADSWVGFLS